MDYTEMLDGAAAASAIFATLFGILIGYRAGKRGIDVVTALYAVSAVACLVASFAMAFMESGPLVVALIVPGGVVPPLAMVALLLDRHLSRSRPVPRWPAPAAGYRRRGE